MNRGARNTIILASAFIALPVSAQTDPRDAWCEGHNNASDDEVILGCTALIKSGGQSTDRLAIEYYNRGNSYRDEHYYDQSIEDYSKAISFNPRYADAYFNRALTYLNGKHLRVRAIADFRSTLKFDPNNQKAKAQLAYFGVAP